MAKPPRVIADQNNQIILERDSQSDRFGIQTFPTVTYIQISVQALKPVESCKAWLTKAEYENDGIFSIEHNERVPLKWSKHNGPDEFEAYLGANEPPVRINVAIYDQNQIGLDGRGGTPTNLLPLLQREGLHRLEIHVAAKSGGRDIQKQFILGIHWEGTQGAWVEQLNNSL